LERFQDDWKCAIGLPASRRVVVGHRDLGPLSVSSSAQAEDP